MLYEISWNLQPGPGVLRSKLTFCSPLFVDGFLLGETAASSWMAHNSSTRFFLHFFCWKLHRRFCIAHRPKSGSEREREWMRYVEQRQHDRKIMVRCVHSNILEAWLWNTYNLCIETSFCDLITINFQSVWLLFVFLTIFLQNSKYSFGAKTKLLKQKPKTYNFIITIRLKLLLGMCSTSVYLVR